MTARLDPTSLERSLPWIRSRARHYASLWPDLDAEDLEGAITERWLTAGKPPRVRWVALDLLRKTIGDERRKPRDPGADFVGHLELPEPPEDRSSISIDAYVLECRALGAKQANTAQQLGVTQAAVSKRLLALDGRRPRSIPRPSGRRSITGHLLESGT